MLRRDKKSEIVAQNFSCVRLSLGNDNKTLIQGFNSSKNSGLAHYLHREAWHEDKSNYRAYYLVRDKNKIVLYFSLQCGLLIQCHKKTLGGITHQNDGDKTQYIIENDKIDVTRVIPGIELAHFCANDSYRRKKADWHIVHGIWKYTVGTYIFYNFVAPKIINVASISGLQYVYLFCADDGSSNLVHYYQNALHFSIMDDMSCVRQQYDSQLCCMTLKIEALIDDTKRFQDMDKVNAILEYLKTNKALSIQQAKKLFNIYDPQYLFKRMIESEVVFLAASTHKGLPIKIEQKPLRPL